MGKRYYWLKLKEDFFDSKRIKKLRRLAGGDTYTIIYLKLQLKAMKSDGILKFDGLENTFAEELALDLDEEPDNVQVTLQYLLSCGLAEASDDTAFFFPYSIENTGSETSSAQRVRECRARKQAISAPSAVPSVQSDEEVLHCNNSVTESKSKSKSKIKEIDIEIEEEKEGETVPAPPVSSLPAFGSYQNVFLSQEEYGKLQRAFPETVGTAIERFSVHLHDSGATYPSHFLRLVNWLTQDTLRRSRK